MARHHSLVVLIFLALVTIVYGHLIDGIFTEPTLEPGYNLVATIPAGATNLNVTELRHTSNYLAVRLQDSSFLLNGNYNINWSGVYKAAGTTFVYHRQTHQQLESFAAIGPLQEPIDVMVLYQEPNPGIVYRYIIPGNAKDNNPIERINRQHLHGHRGHDVGSSKTKRVESTSTSGVEGAIPPFKRYRKRKFGWKPAGLTACSKPCGGGVQTKSHICVREHTQAQVSPKRCHNVEKPLDTQVRCNVGPCPPRWRTGAWSECSASCGSGIRSRELECVQEVNSQLTVHIADGACAEVPSPAITEICEMPACKDDTTTELNIGISHWEARDWSECSVTCGPGTKIRKFECVGHNHSCLSEDQPNEEAACDLGPCSVEPEENSVDKPQWLFTEWTRECSVPCGTGIQSRRVVCEQTDNESCDAISRPDTTRTCSTDRSCSGQWLVGSWTECSSSCDAGEQTRDVVCVTAIHGALRVVLDMNCPVQKPDTRKACIGPPCPPTWFTSDWSECSRSCGRGVQTRVVKCINPGSPLSASECVIDEPISKRSCNEHLCRHSDHGDDSLQSRIQNDPQVNDGLSADESCQDNITNCVLVTQARLCIYPFYRRVCCSSCSSKHDIE